MAELATCEWGEVYQFDTSNDMAVRLQMIIDGLMDQHFPKKTVTRKDSNLPWFNSTAKRMTKKKQERKVGK